MVKGLKGLEDALDLPSLDDALRQQGVAIDPPIKDEPSSDEQIGQTMAALRELTDRMALVDGKDHGEAMDELYGEIVQHARDLMSYGYNVDMPRQRGIFEIASIMFGHAMTAKNSKRDAQLKTVRMALERRRVELEEQRTHHMVGQTATTTGDGTIVVEDRNELIRRLREQIQAEH